MAYQLSFGDGDAEDSFWSRITGYCVQLTRKDGAGMDVEIVGVGPFDEERGFSIEVLRWSDEFAKGSGQPFLVYVDDLAHVHIH
jgi:hypothetical protein